MKGLPLCVGLTNVPYRNTNVPELTYTWTLKRSDAQKQRVGRDGQGLGGWGRWGGTARGV